MYLLDTNVISEPRRPTKANPKVAAWSEQVNQAQLFISVITILEIEMGILQREYRDALQGAHLRTWMESYIRPAFSGRILPLTWKRLCGALNCMCRRSDPSGTR
jgi:toxin FitB